MTDLLKENKKDLQNINDLSQKNIDTLELESKIRKKIEEENKEKMEKFKNKYDNEMNNDNKVTKIQNINEKYDRKLENSLNQRNLIDCEKKNEEDEETKTRLKYLNKTKITEIKNRILIILSEKDILAREIENKRKFFESAENRDIKEYYDLDDKICLLKMDLNKLTISERSNE